MSIQEYFVTDKGRGRKLHLFADCSPTFDRAIARPGTDVERLNLSQCNDCLHRVADPDAVRPSRPKLTPAKPAAKRPSARALLAAQPPRVTTFTCPACGLQKGLSIRLADGTCIDCSDD